MTPMDRRASTTPDTWARMIERAGVPAAITFFVLWRLEHRLDLILQAITNLTLALAGPGAH